MKILAIGDIHGLTDWKEVIKSSSYYDKIIFLGDYVDPYGNINGQDVVENLENIIKFKKLCPDKVILLIGNHDAHYFIAKAVKSTRHNSYIAKELKELYNNNIDLLQFSYQYKNYIFTHAGISQYWFDNIFYGDINKNISEQINSSERGIFDCGISRGGDSISGGILWADISDLENPLKGYTQIVGHNQVPYITISGSIIYCDCLQHNKTYLLLNI